MITIDGDSKLIFLSIEVSHCQIYFIYILMLPRTVQKGTTINTLSDLTSIIVQQLNPTMIGKREFFFKQKKSSNTWQNRRSIYCI